MSDKVYLILGLTTAGFFVFMALFLIWVWIESELHARRIRKLQEESDKKRIPNPPYTDTAYRAKRARFLP